MTVRIEEVSQSTWRTIAALKVSESQRTFIEDNTTSLLEAAYDTSLHWVPLALYKEETIVGFAMVGAYNEQEQSIWLDRLMIDQHWQKLRLRQEIYAVAPRLSFLPLASGKNLFKVPTKKTKRSFRFIPLLALGIPIT